MLSSSLLSVPFLSVIEFGHFALILALCVALSGMMVSVYGQCKQQIALQSVAAPAMALVCGLLTLSFGILIYAFVTSDFSVALVVQNSHSLKPLLYKIAGTWGNHEGSLLLWAWVLSIYGVVLAWSSRTHDLAQKALPVQHGLIVMFLALLILTSNPFMRVFPPALNGNDLNPLLQDPALAFHPPMLYAGYVGYSAVFALAIAGLWTRRIDSVWASLIRPWAMMAWIFLTAGLALGSWWAYYELGWGGWWFWDPVENAALLPWLTGTALIHAVIVLEKRNHLPNWTVLLALLCFALSLLGTFLVRSGVITSVHAFASDPTRGLFILMILVIALGGSLCLYAVRRPQHDDAEQMVLFSREGALTLNNIILASAMVTVLIGTLYPLMLDSITGTLISVGPPYYALTFVPLMIPMLALMAMTPFVAWKHYHLAALWKRIETFSLCTAACGVGLLWWKTDLSLWSVMCFTSGLWVFISAVAYGWERAHYNIRNLFPQNLSVWALVLGHAGLGLAVMGMVGSSFWVQSNSAWLAPQEQITLGDYSLTLQDIRLLTGPNYNSDTAVLSVHDGQKERGVLMPEKRWYPIAGKDTSEVALYPLGVSDLYVTLGTEHADKPGTWMVRVYKHPLINMLWAGVAVMIAGGICAFLSTVLSSFHRKRLS